MPHDTTDRRTDDGQPDERVTDDGQPTERLPDGDPTAPFDSLAGADSTDALGGAFRGALGVPAGRPTELLDVRRLGPPEPLTRTLEALERTDDATVVLQRNDRLPSPLFGLLDERGYRHGAVERDREVLTAVWRD